MIDMMKVMKVGCMDMSWMLHGPYYHSIRRYAAISPTITISKHPAWWLDEALFGLNQPIYTPIHHLCVDGCG